MTVDKLQKVLQAAGIDSRRNIREQIHNGQIKINNKVITDPNFLVDIEKDTIKLDDRRLKVQIERKSYFLFNKPYGVVSTLTDPEGRATITDYIARIKERVYPVGRLDYHSEGLILLTNDGELTNFIISSRNQIPKVYNVKIKGMLTDEEKDQLMTKGIFLEGRRVKPLKIEFVKRTAQKNSWIRVTIVEGKKHIIRNIFKYTGHPVEKLKRLSIGTFQLKNLPSGHWRELTLEEFELFKRTYNYLEPGDTKTLQARPPSREFDKYKREPGDTRTSRAKKPVRNSEFDRDTPPSRERKPSRGFESDSDKKFKKNEKYDGYKKSDRNEKFDSNKRSERSDRFKSDRSDRFKSDRPDRFKSDRSDNFKRSEKTGKPVNHGKTDKPTRTRPKQKPVSEFDEGIFELSS